MFYSYEYCHLILMTFFLRYDDFSLSLCRVQIIARDFHDSSGSVWASKRTVSLGYPMVREGQIGGGMGFIRCEMPQFAYFLDFYRSSLCSFSQYIRPELVQTIQDVWLVYSSGRGGISRSTS